MKKPSDFKPEDMVVYVPKHLLEGEKDKMVEERNKGIVTETNDRYVFVRYNGDENSKATYAQDLFFLNDEIFQK